MPEIAPHTRLRTSPFYEATLKAGVTAFTPYNQMLLPLGYGNTDKEYDHLMNHASLWDVAVERQVQLFGKDAAKLAQILCTRDLSKCKIGQGKYVALCNHAGTIINDPIVLKLDENKFWLSIADANILSWARCVAAERKLEVEVTEPDVSPLAVQGPKAEDLIASIFGDWVREIKYFWFRDAKIENIPLKIARSGWSKQGGFELYLMDGQQGNKLWDLIFEAGKPWNIGYGYPNPCERIESGLLSCGGDSDDQTNPFEVRMEKYVDLDIDDDVIGIEALRGFYKEGIKRHQLGIILDGDLPAKNHQKWYDIFAGNEKIGSMTNGTWSRKLKKNIGFALISTNNTPTERVSIMKDGQEIQGTLCSLPFSSDFG